MTRKWLARVLMALGALGLVGCLVVLVVRVLDLRRAVQAADAAWERNAVDAGDMVRVEASQDIRAFFIDKTEVTVAAYRRCVADGACSEPSRGEFCNNGKADRDRDPVNCVDQHQAAAFCAWAGRRLPRRDEWQLAACERDGGGDRYQGSVGDDCVARDAVWNKDLKGSPISLVSAAKGTCPVDAHPASASSVGALGMAGNVSEWTASEAEPSPGANRFVTVGGHWLARERQETHCRMELSHAPDYRNSLLGFRCVRDDRESLVAELLR